MKKKRVTLILITFIVILQVFNGLLFGSNLNSTVLPHSEAGFSLNSSDVSKATVISDAYGWNDGVSSYPDIAIDNNSNLHVVWKDMTIGEWGGGPGDYEIMYANYTAAGWSNATVISDIFGWNNEDSEYPSVAVDNNSNLHVVWEDETVGEWGGGGVDSEIMYANYTATAGWSNATVISEDSSGWNIDSSERPKIAVDGNSNVHVVWHDDTDGEWGPDQEIMYVNYTVAEGWSNATAISDIYGWNDGSSSSPSVAVDGSGNVHVG